MVQITFFDSDCMKIRKCWACKSWRRSSSFVQPPSPPPQRAASLLALGLRWNHYSSGHDNQGLARPKKERNESERENPWSPQGTPLGGTWDRGSPHHSHLLKVPPWPHWRQCGVGVGGTQGGRGAAAYPPPSPASASLGCERGQGDRSL